MGLLIYLNGKLVPEEEAQISIFDHGLLYGDGVFEGIRGYNGKIFRLYEHLERLYDSAKAIMLDMPLELAAMEKVVIQTVRANELQDCYIRAVVTRGVGDLGLDPRKCKTPTLFVIASKIQLYPEPVYQQGLTVVTVATRRNLSTSVNPAIKSLNYLNNILAKIEANNAGAQEGLILNHEGHVAECTGENIFVVDGKNLYTPPVHAGALDGVTKGVVMELASTLGLTAMEHDLTRYDIHVAKECFLTGTAAEIVPVVMLDGRKIGDGKPGPVTLQLRTEYQRLTESEGVPVYE